MEELREGVREIFCMFWVNNGASVAEDFGNASAIGANDWSGAGHGFGVHEAKGLLE